MTRNALPSAPTRTLAAGQSAAGFPAAEKVVMGMGLAGREALPVGVVQVHHPRPGVAGGEQLGLGREVVLEIGVEVQVVLGEVGEHGDVVVGTRDPAEREGVAGDLHRRGGDVALGHGGQQGLQVGGFGGGQLAGLHVGPDPRFHPADQAGDVPGHPQPGLGQVARGGLAAGPGHPDQPQLPAGVAVHPAGDLAEVGPRVGDHVDGHSRRGGAVPPGRIGEDGHGPGRRRRPH